MPIDKANLKSCQNSLIYSSVRKPHDRFFTKFLIFKDRLEIIFFVPLMRTSKSRIALKPATEITIRAVAIEYTVITANRQTKGLMIAARAFRFTSLFRLDSIILKCLNKQISPFAWGLLSID